MLFGEEEIFKALLPMPKMRAFAISNVALPSIVSLAHILCSFPRLRSLSLHYLDPPGDISQSRDLCSRLQKTEIPSLPLESVQLRRPGANNMELVRLMTLGQSTLTSIDVDCWDIDQLHLARSLIQDHHLQLSDLTLDVASLEQGGKSFPNIVSRPGYRTKSLCYVHRSRTH